MFMKAVVSNFLLSGKFGQKLTTFSGKTRKKASNDVNLGTRIPTDRILLFRTAMHVVLTVDTTVEKITIGIFKFFENFPGKENFPNAPGL